MLRIVRGIVRMFSCALKLYENLFIFPEHISQQQLFMAKELMHILMSTLGPDSNRTINILLDIITKQDYLLLVLYIQLDNTARKNKNQYILSFLSYLMQMKSSVK